MKSQFYKTTGISLSAGSFLAITTMILHPSGGTLQEIISQAAQMQMAHSIAIACIPFMLYGFYGLTDKLLGHRKLSKLALISVALGLFSAMLAALFNGLILPNFLKQHAQSLGQSESFLRIIVNYGFTINKALDYVFIVTLIFGILIYSILIVKTQKISKYLGYFGILILIFSIIGGLTGFAFTSLIGFRIFVFSVAFWILCSGISLIQSNKE